MKKKKLLVVIYDGIRNSVFNSQVFTPLCARLNHDETLYITLVSFEKERLKAQEHLLYFPLPDRFEIIIKKRPPFFGQLSFGAPIRALKSFLRIFNPDSIQARGPLAGYCALKAQKDARPLVIQARGLAGEEYRFESQSVSFSWFKHLVYTLRYHQLCMLEKKVYGTKIPHVMIESVSPALKNYLVTTYQAQENRITIATGDIPHHYEPATCLTWRKTVRARLGLEDSHKVYCYSGSAKTWQCIPEMISYCEEQYKKNSSFFLLILTCDIPVFQNALKASSLPANVYVILNASNEQLYHYLAAADHGLLFRKPDIVNWVSRPTKMLEYQAVCLPIIHNKTVALLA